MDEMNFLVKRSQSAFQIQPDNHHSLLGWDLGQIVVNLIRCEIQIDD